MIFKEFDPNKDDCHKVAKLTYSVDEKTYFKIFGSETNAISAIKKLFLVEKDDFIPRAGVLKDIDSDIHVVDNDIRNNTDNNNIEYANEFYVILDENNKDNFENNKYIIGIIQIIKGKTNVLFDGILSLFKNLRISDALRFSFIYFLDYFTISKINADDLYIAEIAIDENQRGEGFGTHVLLHVIKKARDKNFKRVVLDADLDNKGAIKLYKSLGFKIFNKRSIKFFNKKKTMYNMEYVI